MSRFPACIVAVALGASAAWAEDRAPSPQGTVDVAFAVDQPRADEPLHHVRYRVRFYYPHQNTVAAEDEFIDVYGEGPDAKPTPIATLRKAILWSPREDFAVLPKEQWPEGHAQKARQAVSLNTSFAWQETDFPLAPTPLAWVDRYVAIGNLDAHCQKSVAEFDAHTGKVTSIVEGESPYGFEVSTVSGEKVTMKKVLTECATPSDQKTFKPECRTMDVRFMRQEVSTCP